MADPKPPFVLTRTQRKLLERALAGPVDSPSTKSNFGSWEKMVGKLERAGLLREVQEGRVRFLRYAITDAGRVALEK